MKTQANIVGFSLLLFLLASYTDGIAQCGMMSHDNSGNAAQETNLTDTTKTGQAFYYTCSMHPEIVSETPGNCPKCGMTLVKTSANKKQKKGMMKMMGMETMTVVMVATMALMLVGWMTFGVGR